MNIKPILKVEDGKIEAVERVRTRRKAMARLLDLVAEEVGGSPVNLSSLNANAVEEAESLLNEAKARFDALQTNISNVSPVIGTHVGPGTIGLVYMRA